MQESRLTEESTNLNWIWAKSCNLGEQEHPYIMLFRKKIEIEGTPEDGELRISADTRYKLYINDELVETGPSRGDRHVWFYDTISLVSRMRQGSNVLSVAVLRYPEDPEKGNHGMFRTALPGLYITGYVTDDDGRRYNLSADSSWKCRRDEQIAFVREEERFAPLIIHEKAQGNPAVFGWRGVDFDDSTWEKAAPYGREQIRTISCLSDLKPRTIPYLYRKSRCFSGIMDMKRSSHGKEDWLAFLKDEKNLVIPAESEEFIEIDAGEEMTGYLKMKFCGGAGSRVSLLYSEAYVMDGVSGPEQVPNKGDRTDFVNGHLQGYEDQYTVGGFGTSDMPETFEPFWFRTFRFIQLHIITGEEPLTLRSLDYEETGYPLQAATTVSTSDKSLDAIWEISERTLRRCMHETYEDCPFYEQLQYIMDARLDILYTYAVSADDRLARKCMDDMRRAQRPDGLMNCSYPNCAVNVIPTFSIYYILMVYDHMMYFGDRDLVEEHMPVIDRVLDFFERHLAPQGYVEKIGGRNHRGHFWSFVDWTKEWNDTDGMPSAGLQKPLTVQSLLYIYGLQHAGKLADYLGSEEIARGYYARAKRVQQAIRRYCIGKNGMLQDAPGVEEYSQHCQVFGILTDTIDVPARRKILLETVRDKSYTQCTVAMSFYLFRALEKTGLYEYTDQYWDVWRRMIENHCTTCVEAEAYARSECHAWGSLILYELPSVILGVRPAEPGCRKLLIAPVPGYLTSASGKVRTPRGDVELSWELTDGRMRMEYRLPDGVEAVISEAGTVPQYYISEGKRAI